MGAIPPSPFVSHKFPLSLYGLLISMVLTSFVPFWAYILLLTGNFWSYGVLGQTTPVDTAEQDDPHFMGWYIGPSTSEYTS
jgi:hypothetical protein